MKLKHAWYDYNLSKHTDHAVSLLKRLESKLISQETRLAVPFVFRGRGHFKSMECMQNPYEIETLYRKVCHLKPRRVLEIGTAKGGALYLWLQAAHDEAQVVSVDLPGGEFGGGYVDGKIEFYHAFAKPKQDLHLMRANSHYPETLAAVKDIFAGEKIDFLFIDGDHTYEGVKQDFEQYSPLVRSGGLIAFHDILARPDIPDIQVDKFWREVKENYETEEIIGLPGTGRKIGCGLLEIP